MLVAIKRIWNRLHWPENHQKDGLETMSEYCERWRSIRTVYFTIFIMNMGFGIVLIGVWPYLHKLDPNAGKEFLGYVVAASPLGPLLFSTLIGHWGNSIKSIRLPMIVSIVVFFLSNALYASLYAIPIGCVKYVMVFSRFLSGFGTACLALGRAYVVEATRASERTGAVAMGSMAMTLGVIVGPSLQSGVTFLGENGLTLIPGIIQVDMYTACGWINAALSIVSFILFLPVFFKERRIAVIEVMVQKGMASEAETYQNVPVDLLAVWSLLIGFFIISFNFISFETIVTTLVMDQYAWSAAVALYYVGLMMTGGAILTILTFILVPKLCRIFSERYLLIFGGFLLMVLSRLLFIPFFGSSLPKMADPCTVSPTNTSSINGSDCSEQVGCPITQEWCKTTPALPLAQLILGIAIAAIAYPICITLLQTLYSRVLSCRPQAVWIGFLIVSGSLARSLGPIGVGYIYPLYGTYWTFGITVVSVMLGTLWMWLIRHRLSDDSAKDGMVVIDTRL